MKIRKFYPFLCMVLCLTLLAGCTSPLNVPPRPRITGGYTLCCTVKTEVTPADKETPEEFVFSGNVKRLGSGFWEMEITAPESLEGLKIVLSGDNVTSSLGELSFSSELSAIPKKSPAMTVFRCLDNAAVALGNGVSPEAASGVQGWTLTTGEYSLLFDNDGVPVAMTAAGFSAEFTEFTVTGGETLGSSK
ncbi:MAG: hypothetical protein K2K57_04250 [Oscillospiraceae bacterium]|nr:hypothetical protein [Oscillospiraceae bacterium]